MSRFRLLPVTAAAALSAVSLLAQGPFVYTNNATMTGGVNNNTVSGFSITAAGVPVPIPGSPWPTGGTPSFHGGGFAANHIIVAKTFLFASNASSTSVAAYSINPAAGVLTAVPGSPFILPNTITPGDMSLGATPDGKFLFAAYAAGNLGVSSITAFSIAANGVLTPVPGSPFAVPGRPLSIKVAPVDGRFLAVADPVNGIAMFSITGTGGLIPVGGSPFAAPAATLPAGPDCNCGQTRLFTGVGSSTNSQVDVFNIAPSGALTSLAGSPFAGGGVNSNVAVLSPDDTHLFVSNQASSSIDVFNVAANGALSLVAGSPFATGTQTPTGLATDVTGGWLFGANLQNLLTIFRVGASGALTAVPGSPFSTGATGGLLTSLAVFPPKNCCPAPTISRVSATPNVLKQRDKKFVEVNIGYDVTEPCPNSCVLTVTSNQPVRRSDDDEKSSPDWVVIDSHHVLLRADREGDNRAGHVYTVTITCTNTTDGLSSTKTVTVSAPHDNRD